MIYRGQLTNGHAMTQHAPGVVCIVTGIRKNQWSAKDNGRLVVIERFSRLSPRNGAVWTVRPYRTEDGPLHVMSMTNVGGRQPRMVWRVNAAQKHLIPIRPEKEFNEQVRVGKLIKAEVING